MNTSILRKCLEELGKDSPKLDYIRGMLETLIEMQGAQKTVLLPPSTYIPNITYTTAPTTDEASILEAKARVAMDKMKDIKPGTVETQ